MQRGRSEKGVFSLPEEEEKVLRYWQQHQIFARSVAQRAKSRKRFVFYEGPPYANGKPGVHHVLSRVYKDIILRFRTMRGYFVPRRAGWDTHGLPVEIAAEKALGLSSKRDIERLGIARFNKKAKELVWLYRDEWNKITERVGYWLDLSRAYVTYRNEYIETLWWILKRIWERKLLYQGKRVVPWCPRCGTALSSHELAQGYKEVTDASVYVRFRLLSSRGSTRVRLGGKTFSNLFILSWTTTPWTLPGNVALAVGGEMTYVVAEARDAEGKTFLAVVAEASPLGKKLRGKVHARVKGKELAGLSYAPLFSVPSLRTAAAHKIYVAEFVTPDEGTGVVHTAVMYGVDDFALGERVGLPQHHTVDEEGKFTADVKELKGHFVKSSATEQRIFRILQEKGALLQVVPYTHEYPYCWRCDSPVLYYARTSWFIAMRSLRDKLLRENTRINWLPPHIREGRFGEWLREVKDWNISRERYWGTPLPVWDCASCGARKLVGSIEDLRAHGASVNTFFFLRHGEADHNILEVCAPAHDSRKFTSRLTPRGKRQVQAAARKLAKEGIDLIYTSPLLRTRETAAIISRATGAPVKVAKGLREIDPGDFEGKPIEEYRAYFASELDRFSASPPGGESKNQVKERVWRFFQRVNSLHRGKRILFVSHGDPLWLLKGAAEGLRNEEILQAPYPQVGKLYPIATRPIPRNEEGLLDLHRPYIDAILLRCEKCGGAMRRVKDVIDVWFDSGAMPFAQDHWPFARARANGRSVAPPREYPADYIAEGIDQTRGWFYTMLAIATALGYQAPYRNVVVLGLIHDKHGKKMSKSRGNIVEPWSVINSYGADALRWYFYTVNPASEPKNFDERDVAKALRRFHLLVYHTVAFYLTYARAQKNAPPPQRASHPLDAWILARLAAVHKEVTEALDRYHVREAALSLEKFADDLSRWYVRRSRRRFQKPDSKDDFRAASAVLGYVLETLVRLLAPFTPFFAEFLWQKMGKKRSVHLTDWPSVPRRFAREKILDAMQEVRRLAALALASRAAAKIKVRQPLRELRFRTASREVAQHKILQEILAAEVNVQQVRFQKDLKEEVALDTTLTPALREEGTAREIVRLIQGLRQKAGYQMRDRAALFVRADAQTSSVITKFSSFIKREAGISQILFKKAPQFDAEAEVVLEGSKLWIGIQKR